VRVALVARVHSDHEAEIVRRGVDGVPRRGVVQALHDFQRPLDPPVGLDLNVRGDFVGRLEKVLRRRLGREVGEDELVVVAAVLKPSAAIVMLVGEEVQDLTSIVPFPHVAFHAPPLKLIQLYFVSPGPEPRGMLGWRSHSMVKSRSMLGMAMVQLVNCGASEEYVGSCPYSCDMPRLVAVAAATRRLRRILKLNRVGLAREKN